MTAADGAMSEQVVPDGERVRIAWHEAAHAVVAWRLGRDVLSVSMDPQGEHYGQVTHSARSWDGPPITDWLIPIRGELRDVMETDILIALAGHFGEDLIEPRSGYGLRPDHEWTERAAVALANYSARHAELIARAQRGEDVAEPVSHDDRLAMLASLGLAGAEASAHLAWMRAIARRLVSESAHVIHRLAEALLAEPSRVIDGERATAIIEGAQA